MPPGGGHGGGGHGHGGHGHGGHHEERRKFKSLVSQFFSVTLMYMFFDQSQEHRISFCSATKGSWR